MDGDEKGSEEEVKGEERRVLQTEEIRRIFWGGCLTGYKNFSFYFKLIT